MSFVDDNIYSIYRIGVFILKHYWKHIIGIEYCYKRKYHYFNLFQLHTRYPHFFPQFVTRLNKCQIQNHLSGIKLHLACLQIQNLFLHFTKARYVMFPENHCTTRHLFNIVWKRL